MDCYCDSRARMDLSAILMYDGGKIQFQRVFRDEADESSRNLMSSV